MLLSSCHCFDHFTQVVKKNMIENIIPIIIELKHMVRLLECLCLAFNDVYFFIFQKGFLSCDYAPTGFVILQLEKQHSPLLKDLMSCLKEVMKDYRSEVQDVLSADRQLANEIEFDLKRFEEQQKELEEWNRKQNTPSSSPQV